MDAQLIRGYVRRKRKTFLGTIALLLILAVEFYYLNCYTLYAGGFCELTFVFIGIAIMVANIYIWFKGDGKSDKKAAP